MKTSYSLLLAATLALIGLAHADDDEHGSGGKRPKQLAISAKAPAVWKTECSSCHMAYPPCLLPPAAWQQHMDTLKNHYGSNATLDAGDEKTIRDFLRVASAANKQPVVRAKAGEPPRITTTAWFINKHDEVRADVWRRKSIGSAANCQACHSGADKGDFDEDGVSIPR
ncbi:cytochrome C [Vogesella amnigena]|uniref:Cytochrome C n=1 Tax=Vogesella amnigena TaxID=1507449 RepID=A0ABV7TSL9_9NEIS